MNLLLHFYILANVQPEKTALVIERKFLSKNKTGNFGKFLCTESIRNSRLENFSSKSRSFTQKDSKLWLEYIETKPNLKRILLRSTRMEMMHKTV